MAGLTGTVTNVYGEAQIAIKTDIPSLTQVTSDLHTLSIKKMREKFLKGVSDEQRKQLTKEELEFDANFMILVRSEDIEKI